MPPRRLPGAGAGKKGSAGRVICRKNRIWVDGVGKVARGPCGASLSSRQGLYNHGQKAHVHGGFTCPDCVLPFATEDALELHLKSCRDPERGHRCQFCFVYRTGVEFSQHVKERHSAEVAEIVQYRRTQHALSSRETKRREEGRVSRNLFECEDCKAVFATRGSLQRHRNGDRDQLSACRFLLHENNVCKYCGRGFQFKRLLQFHLRARDCSQFIETDSISAEADVEFIHH